MKCLLQIENLFKHEICLDDVQHHSQNTKFWAISRPLNTLSAHNTLLFIVGADLISAQSIFQYCGTIWNRPLRNVNNNID